MSNDAAKHLPALLLFIALVLVIALMRYEMKERRYGAPVPEPAYRMSEPPAPPAPVEVEDGPK